jgi:hypothetical protein
METYRIYEVYSSLHSYRTLIEMTDLRFLTFVNSDIIIISLGAIYRMYLIAPTDPF